MYLSRVQIDTNNRQKLQDLTHLGAYHGWVESCFSYPDTDRPRNLWRIDRLNHHDYLLLLSPNQPNLKRLSTYGVPHTAQTKSYDAFLTNLDPNRRYRFRLTANPSHHDGDKIYPHVTVAQQKQWLLKQQDSHGFVIPNNQFDITSRGYKNLIHAPRKTPIRLSQVTFEGILSISDLNLFTHTLTHGIGREKAYGMGLMTVIPVQRG